MKTYIQNGHVITVPTPAGGIASGDGLIVGNIFGVAAYSAAEGDPLESSAIKLVHTLRAGDISRILVG